MHIESITKKGKKKKRNRNTLALTIETWYIEGIWTNQFFSWYYTGNINNTFSFFFL